jgi:glucose uptake protein GlcU
MQDFLFYIQLGFDHVMDPSAYDHILFLTALALPFTFRSWKKVLILATVFTVTHCLSLALSAYGIFRVDTSWIEFLIPITIMLTALFDLLYTQKDADEMGTYLHVLATAFFGLIHGFGFSNYFNMLMATTEQKLVPLLGFAAGIELSQVIIILAILLLAFLLQRRLHVKRIPFIITGAIIVALITIPMLVETFPS